MVLRGLGRVLAGVVLIDVAEFDVFIGGFLYLSGQLVDLFAVVLVGRVTVNASRCSSVSTTKCSLLPWLFLWPS